MTEILDLDDLEPQDDKEPFQFRFDGELYTCRSPQSMDVRKLEALILDSQSNPAVQLAWMLGEEQWDRLAASPKEFRLEHLNAVTEQWLGHYGIDLPKSAGSPASSRIIAAS